MRHRSMQLSHTFDPNAMYTSDKIVEKHICLKETLLNLDLEPKKVKVIAKNRIIHKGTKILHLLNKQSRGSLGNCCAANESNRL